MNKDDLKMLLIQLVNEIGYESFSGAKFDSLLHDNHHLRLTKCYDWKYANWTSSIFMIFVDFGALIDCGVIILTASGFQSRRQIILIMIKNHK